MKVRVELKNKNNKKIYIYSASILLGFTRARLKN